MKILKFTTSVCFLMILLAIATTTAKTQCNYSCPEQSCDGGLIWDFGACVCIQPGSPIIIDLDNNGYDLTDAANGVRFDLAGDGKRQQWSWTARGGDEAFLALDRDGDGRITSGLELFGNFTEQPVTEEPNGFIALGVFDTNGDRWINANDAIYQRLQLWIDSNHNGVSQPHELFSLSDKGVEGISCNYKLSKRSDRHGNRFRYKALARINGIECWVWDIFFLPGK
ncbi:MAG: hypothetical protein AB7U82_35265 [Blastocatellales bacterium]